MIWPVWPLATLSGSKQITSTKMLRKHKWHLISTHQKLGRAIEINITMNVVWLENDDEFCLKFFKEGQTNHKIVYLGIFTS